MQVSTGQWQITRASLLEDHVRFGLKTRADAESHLDGLLGRIRTAFHKVAPLLPPDLRTMMEIRMLENCALLVPPGKPATDKLRR